MLRRMMMALGGLGAAVGVAALGTASAGPGGQAQGGGTAAVDSRLPPIDLAARQVRAQTATFALG